MSLTVVISVIIVFGLLIFVHELGHLLFAKRAGILCREFAIGFGPKLFSFKRNETLYTIRILPLGGYVRMAGEDPEIIEIKPGHDIGLILNQQHKVVKIITRDFQKHPQAKVINVRKIDLIHELMIEGYEEDDQLVTYQVDEQAEINYQNIDTQIAPYNRQFGSKTKIQRALTLFAGPLFNFLLAFVLLVFFALYNGIAVDEPIIGEVLEETAAAEAGLQYGDRVTSIAGRNVTNWTELQQLIGQNPEKEIDLTIQRDGQNIEISITPHARESRLDAGQMEGYIGVRPATERSFTRSFAFGFNLTVEYAQLIFTALGMLVSGGFNIDDLAGPVGIIEFTGNAAREGLAMLVHWTALLSINLAIMNLLPIPALDGGRLLFILIEALRGKPIDPQKEGIVHFIGFALLMLLILVVTWNDIQRLFS